MTNLPTGFDIRKSRVYSTLSSNQGSPPTLGDEQEDDLDGIESIDVDNRNNNQRSSTSRARVPTYLEIKEKNIKENKRLLQLINDEHKSAPTSKTFTGSLDVDAINERVAKVLSSFYG
jgi:hypothetical protein